MKTFIVINQGYPMDVHAENCKDLNSPKYRREPKDWKIKGETVEAAVAAETTSLNADFDHPYDSTELFRIFPCCKAVK